jgi:pimeloyl-ACP methyl ester carboxylesterase
MKNISDTGAYSIYDHLVSKTVRSLSHVVGLRKITQPFWARWLASGVNAEVIFRFLDRLGSVDGWATAANDVVAGEVEAYDRRAATLDDAQRVAALRELSYLCNLGQWGCLPITDARRHLYRLCRDYYVEAESMAHGTAYQRLSIPFEDLQLHANLHVAAGPPAPLIVIVHGIDGCKEEHLATELDLLQAGFSVLGMDGPGQAESLLLDNVLWRRTFPKAISAALDVVAARALADVARTGVLGISIGATWALMASADDHRIAAVYDLGALINMKRFAKFPFLIKTRICQTSGARDASALDRALASNTLENDDMLRRIGARVRILHGERDRVVALDEKRWLQGKLQAFHPDRSVSLRVIEGGDHCCTGHAHDVRRDAAKFFTSALRGDQGGSDLSRPPPRHRASI